MHKSMREIEAFELSLSRWTADRDVWNAKAAEQIDARHSSISFFISSYF